MKDRVLSNLSVMSISGTLVEGAGMTFLNPELYGDVVEVLVPAPNTMIQSPRSTRTQNKYCLSFDSNLLVLDASDRVVDCC